MKWSSVGPGEALGNPPFSSTYSSILIYTLKGSPSQRYVLKANRLQFLKGEPETKVTLAGISSPCLGAARPLPKRSCSS